MELVHQQQVGCREDRTTVEAGVEAIVALYDGPVDGKERETRGFQCLIQSGRWGAFLACLKSIFLLL